MVNFEQNLMNQINTAINDLNKPENINTKTFIRDFNDRCGFIWSSDPMMKIVMELIPPDEHSGCSYASMLRTIQSKLKQ